MRFLALVLAGVLVACGAEPAAELPLLEPEAGEEREEGEMLEGTLGGDPQLEGGCAWLETDDGRFEVQYPEGYEIAFSPVRLLGPDGETVAEEGQTLRVEGRIAGDIMSVCQVGTIFQATEVMPG